MDWKHKDMWSIRGKDFMVQVSRHAEPSREESSGCFDAEGPHRWCVYAYIYPKHPHFAAFKGNDLWQEATGVLPLHAGCSFLTYHRRDSGDVTSVQVGCDYNHLHDNEYTQHATKEEAWEVFVDAEQLVARLTNMCEVAA